MKHFLFKTTIVLLLAYSHTAVHAQEGLSAADGKATGSTGSVTYTIGQVFYTIHKSNNGQMAEGVQLPFEISMVGIEKAPDIQLLCFPNPTTNLLTLKTDNDLGTLSYQLFDVKGKLLIHNQLTGTNTNIRMGEYPPGIYFIKVININKAIKTFKIIKNPSL